MGEVNMPHSRFTILRDMAKKLNSLAENWENQDGQVNTRNSGIKSSTSSPDRDAQILKEAERIYRSRRKRERLLSSKYFGEPAWDIILDLFIAAERGRKVHVSSACIASAVPTSTALRWIAILENEGVVERNNDKSDGRASYIKITEKGIDLVRSYLNQVV